MAGEQRRQGPQHSRQVFGGNWHRHSPALVCSMLPSTEELVATRGLKVACTTAASARPSTSPSTCTRAKAAVRAGFVGHHALVHLGCAAPAPGAGPGLHADRLT
jgi:hypothetical protein